MQDVARRAGVALSTVSATLSASRPVSAATRARVQAAMDELGYRPNMLARGLASRRSRVIALTYPVGEAGMSRTSADFVDGAAKAARDRGYQLVLWPFDVEATDPLLDAAGQGLADGVLLMEVHADDARVRTLHGAGIPLALIGRTGQDTDLPVVDIDFEATLRQTVAHLAALGHREIVMLNHDAARLAAGHGPTLRASAAYADACAAHAITVREHFVEESVDGGRRAAARVLDGPTPAPTAVVVMNEDATFGLMAELATRRVDVPTDLSVLALVSSPGVAGLTVPPLTTFDAPGARLGRAGVDALLRLLETGQVPEPVLVPCDLVDSGSTAPVPAGRSGPTDPDAAPVVSAARACD